MSIFFISETFSAVLESQFSNSIPVLIWPVVVPNPAAAQGMSLGVQRTVSSEGTGQLQPSDNSNRRYQCEPIQRWFSILEITFLLVENKEGKYTRKPLYYKRPLDYAVILRAAIFIPSVQSLYKCNLA